MRNSSIRVFVYGTLQADQRAADMLARFPREHATVGGFRLYSLRGYPFAVKAEGFLVGELVTIDRATLADLDHYEGGQYRRVSVRVRPVWGEETSAMIYAWAGAIPPEPEALPWPVGERWTREGADRIRLASEHARAHGALCRDTGDRTCRCGVSLSPGECGCAGYHRVACPEHV